MFQKNIGTLDRILRGLIAVVLFGFAYFYHSAILFVASAFVAFEAVFSWCAFYQLIGRNTCPIEVKKRKPKPKLKLKKKLNQKKRYR